MRTLFISAFVLLMASPVMAQITGTGGIGYGVTLPATCSTGDVFAASGNRNVSMCVALNTWVPLLPSVLGKGTAVNLNSVADTAIAITATKYRITKFTITNCSATPVLAQIAFYTATAAGGTNLVAATTIAALTGATKFSDLTLAVNTDTRAEATLYARNTVAQTSALTCDAYIIGDILP